MAELETNAADTFSKNGRQCFKLSGYVQGQGSYLDVHMCEGVKTEQVVQMSYPKMKQKQVCRGGVIRHVERGKTKG